MSSTQEYNCIFCKEAFENKEDLQVHFRKHGDPNFDASAKSKVRLQNEPQVPSEIVEQVSCDVCTEVFPTISKAITHKHKVHPDHDAKYFCPWCGKLFTMKHLYNKHLETNHKDMWNSKDHNFHCDCCDVDFYVPTAMQNHNKFFHRQDTELPNIGLSKKVKIYNQETVQVYYCAFCGEEFNNKVNLCKHMSDDHCDENQAPENVLRCPLCEATFHHLDAYELHLTFHSSEDLYSEENEMFKTISDFSLESVPPIMEKVESEVQETIESDINAIGIDNFLQLAMEESADNDVSNNEQISEKVKPKKHKKHKKSKKSAITLDEFLSMNQDVFGEGLDFQGIEEVPTQVVAKRLKNKRPQAPLKAKARDPDLEKLKKQGIVVKTKTGNKSFNLNNRKISSELPLRTPVKVAQTNISNRPMSQVKSNVINTSDDVLTKLINQSNNQIKIVKKSLQDNSDNKVSGITLSTDNKTANFENLPENKHEKAAANDAVESVNQEMVEKSVENESIPGDIDTSKSMKINKNSDMTHENKNLEFNENEIENDNAIENDVGHEDNMGNVESPKSTIEKESINDNLTALRNISQHITIKSLSPKNLQPVIKQKHESKTEELHDSHSECDKNVKDENNENTGDRNDTKINSLNALKHLSHLITIKSVNQSNPLASHDKEETKFDVRKQSQELEHIVDKNKVVSRPIVKSTSEKSRLPTKTIDALKNLNKNVVIKPFTQVTKSTVGNNANIANNSEDEFEETRDCDINNEEVKPVINSNLQLSDKIVKVKTEMPVSPERVARTCNSPKPINKAKPGPKVSKNNNPNNENSEKCSNLLKHLPNLIAKPISKKTYTREVISTQNSSTSKGYETNECITKVEKHEEIEIFNIDDSDSDDDNRKCSEDQKVCDPGGDLQKASISNNDSSKSIDALKNLNKFITVKSTASNKKPETSLQDISRAEESNEDNNRYKIAVRKEDLQKSHKNVALSHALKNISKNVTIKSRNSSPSLPLKSQDHNRQEFNTHPESNHDSDCDSNSWPDNVKISELNDDDISDTELNGENNKNMIVQSPDDSDSEYNHKETEEQLAGIDNQNRVNASQKQISHNLNKNSLCLDNLKNMNKGITIKSLNNSKNETKSTYSKNVKVANSNRELSITPYRPGKILNEEDDDDGECDNQIPSIPIKAGPSKNVINPTIKQKITPSTNLHNAISQKIASSSNQVNTINKEVTVKTFQTKTVIQEITTTVTKTIRTVNQSMKQEIQSVQNTSSPMIRTPQKVQGMRPSNIKNFQGMAVRHSSPNVGLKIRNAPTPTRPTMGTPIKVSNQVVPVRASINVARPSRPRMPTAKKIMPPTANTHLNAIGKPIKIAPNAMNSPIKRSTGEEVSGPFSCFKKPKESLIPVSDIPVFSRDQEGESAAHFASASHSSKTNFSSSTKIIKGSSTVTSTQMKTEMSTSSQQQLNRLGNMSGLKVVKTSQAKQATQVVENSEISATKRTTLEAIEKLQRHGLLVKKPRLEPSDSDHSNVDEDKDFEDDI